ncbi:MAG: hypothetical protein PHV07_07370, partial [Oscillospiraceae bacterium]|nr:hypothetical protein [Oscillospiraceae bacterium]
NTKKVYTTERYISQYDKLNRSALNKNICVEKNNNFQFFNGKTFSKERIGVVPDGENAYYYRPDITNTGVATTSIFSQELVFGFLSNQENWTITGVEEYLGRQVVVLSGKVTDDYYSSKLNVKTFEMRVDINTGILLDLKAYSPKGDLSQYVTTKNIIIDSFSSDLKSFLDNSINSKGSEYSLRVAIC